MPDTGERLARLEGSEPHMATKGELIEAIADFKADMQAFRYWVEQEFKTHAQAIANIQHILTTEGVKVDVRQLGFPLPNQGEGQPGSQRSQRG